MICCWVSLARKVSRNFVSMNDMLLGFPFKRNQGMTLTPSQKLASHIIISKILWVSHFPTCKRKIVNELYIWYQGHDWINKIGTYSGHCPLKFWQKKLYSSWLFHVQGLDSPSKDIVGCPLYVWIDANYTIIVAYSRHLQAHGVSCNV